MQVKIPKTKRRSPPKISDLRDNDIELLAQAAMAPGNTLFCFGRCYGKLRALELIDDESNVTLTGKKYLRSIKQ